MSTNPEIPSPQAQEREKLIAEALRAICDDAEGPLEGDDAGCMTVNADLIAAGLALLQPLPPSGNGAWQPIAIAPKDGTHVLLWCVDEQGDGIEAVGAWFSGWTNPMTSLRLREDEPSFWMPLPLPPSQGTTKDEERNESA